jgi:hypothetical protein
MTVIDYRSKTPGSQQPESLLKYRLLQFAMALLAPLLIGIICWPGPHGGSQFLGEVLIVEFAHMAREWPVLVLLSIPTIGLVSASMLPCRRPRVIVSGISVIWFLTLFGLLLLRVYPPAWPWVFISAAPHFGALGAGFWLSRLPRPT